MAAEAPRIMKRHASTAAVQHVAFNFEDMKQRCDEYRERTRQECVQLLSDARQQIEQDREQAVQQGHAEGYRNGLKQAEEEIRQKAQQLAEQLVEQRLQTVLPAASELLQELSTARQRCQADWEQELVGMSIAIAQRVIGRIRQTEPDRVIDVVRDAVGLAVGKTSVELRLAPTDLEALGDRVRTAVEHSAHGMACRLVADESIAPGGCVVATENGQIDARIETMLDRIAAEMLEGVV
ncbi:MAG: FliH/SctL family protein [Planctomycetota bacterium]|jgi:flagellar assembly protein FliH